MVEISKIDFDPSDNDLLIKAIYDIRNVEEWDLMIGSKIPKNYISKLKDGNHNCCIVVRYDDRIIQIFEFKKRVKKTC